MKQCIIFILLFVFFKNGQPLSKSDNIKHFVLVHGAGHGAWCWYKLAPLLQKSGHNVTTIDLAAAGRDLRRATDLRSFSDYTKPLRELVASSSSNTKMVLVGHSMGGLAISQAVEMFPEKISCAVFVAALMPGPYNNASSIMNRYFDQRPPLLDTKVVYDETTGRTENFLGPNYLRKNLYQLSPVEDWSLATMLVREVTVFKSEELSREVKLSARNYGSVKRVYVRTGKDRSMKPRLQRWMIKRSPPNDVKVIHGSDHMAMMSATRQLWSVLVDL